MELLLLSLLGITAAAIIAAYANVKQTMPYLYANARLSARKLYSVEDKYEELARSKNIDELVSKLQGSEYYEILTKANSIKEMHLMLEQHLVAKIKELEEITPKDLQSLLRDYLTFYEVPIIKTIYRSKLTNEPCNELCYVIGSIDETLLRHMLEAKTIADLKVVLAETKYNNVLQKDYESLEEFEVAIESFALQNFLDSLKKAKIGHKKEVAEMLNLKFDIKNLLMLINCIIRNVGIEKRKKLFIKNKSSWSKEASEKMLNVENIENLKNALDGTLKHAFDKVYSEYEKNKKLSSIEIGLMRFYKEYILNKEVLHGLGIIPIFTYIIKKEIEIKNLAAIIKGIDTGFTKEEILSLVV